MKKSSLKTYFIHVENSLFDKRYQYLLFAAEPYEIIAFKVPSTEIDKLTPKFFSYWDPDSKMFTLQLYFKIKPPEANKPQSAITANGTADPGVPPRSLPRPLQAPPPPPLPQRLTAGSRPLPPPVLGSLTPPSPPPMAVVPRPMLPSGTPPAPPPPIGGSGTMVNFPPGTQVGGPPPVPLQGFPSQQMQGQVVHPPPPPVPNMGQ